MNVKRMLAWTEDKEMWPQRAEPDRRGGRGRGGRKKTRAVSKITPYLLHSAKYLLCRVWSLSLKMSPLCSTLKTPPKSSIHGMYTSFCQPSHNVKPCIYRSEKLLWWFSVWNLNLLLGKLLIVHYIGGSKWVRGDFGHSHDKDKK